MFVFKYYQKALCNESNQFYLTVKFYTDTGNTQSRITKSNLQNRIYFLQNTISSPVEL